MCLFCFSLIILLLHILQLLRLYAPGYSHLASYCFMHSSLQVNHHIIQSQIAVEISTTLHCRIIWFRASTAKYPSTQNTPKSTLATDRGSHSLLSSGTSCFRYPVLTFSSVYFLGYFYLYVFFLAFYPAIFSSRIIRPVLYSRLLSRRRRSQTASA